MIDIEDKNALVQISENNSAGFKFVFDKYYSGLCDFACLYIHSTDEATDLVTDFFIKFWNQRHQIDISGSLKSYLFKCIKNASLNHLRGKKNEMMNYEDFAEVLVSTELSPNEQIEFKEFQDELEVFTNSLPEKRKLILQLKIKSGLSNHEIAETLQLAESTVRNQLRSALEGLRKRFQIKK